MLRLACAYRFRPVDDAKPLALPAPPSSRAQCPCPRLQQPTSFPLAVGGTPAGIVGLHKVYEYTEGWNVCGCQACPCTGPALRGTPTGLGEEHLARTSQQTVEASVNRPRVVCAAPPCTL